MVAAKELLWLDPRELVDDPQNVRTTTDELEGLAESIREHGVLQPLGVARSGQDYQIVFGSRRRQAAILAGLETVPCVEVRGSADDRLVKQLLENLQRRDLNDMEKAEGFARLRRQIAARPGFEGSPDEAVARALGVSVRTVQRYLGLRDLPSEVRDLIQEGDLTVTQAQHLRALPSDTQRVEVARVVVDRGLSAATTSRLCQALCKQPGLTAETALAAIESGVELPDIRGNTPSTVTAAIPAAHATVVKEPTESDADLWEDEPDDAEDEEFNPPAPTTADGHRRFRIRSVDAFCDTVERLAQSLQDGDLAKAAAQDAAAPIKLRLAARQLAFASKELAAFIESRGWGE